MTEETRRPAAKNLPFSRHELYPPSLFRALEIDLPSSPFGREDGPARRFCPISCRRAPNRPYRLVKMRQGHRGSRNAEGACTGF